MDDTRFLTEVGAGKQRSVYISRVQNDLHAVPGEGVTHSCAGAEGSKVAADGEDFILLI